MTIAVCAITEQGRRLAEKITAGLGSAVLLPNGKGVRSTIEQAWDRYDGLVCIMAAGIVVRCIAGLCRNKRIDPAVVVVDDRGEHVIALLSGHLGGANGLAKEIAAAIGGRPVITTGSDVSGHTALDLWAEEHGLAVVNPELLPELGTRLLDRGTLKVFMDSGRNLPLPSDFLGCAQRQEADVVIAPQGEVPNSALWLLPRCRYLGLGCRKGAPVADFEAALDDLQRRFDLDPRSIAAVASIDVKRWEPGLRQFAEVHRWPLRFFSKDQLNLAEAPSVSPTVFAKVGAHSVCEAAALLAARTLEKPAKLIINKVKWKTITAAVAQREE